MESPPSLELGLGPAPRPDLGFIYVGDPMCSWCWGFAPALEQLERRDGWHYDTEPSCRAVVAMRELAPGDTLRWVARLHRAFYVDGVTDETVLPTLRDGFDVDPRRFASLLADEATAQRTRQDFREAQRYGADRLPDPAAARRRGARHRDPRLRALGAARAGADPLAGGPLRRSHRRAGLRPSHGSVLSPPVRHHEPAAGLTAPGRAPARAAGATPRRWSGRPGRRATAGRW